MHGINQDVLDGAIDLDGVAEQRARVLANISFQFDPALRGHRVHALDDFAENGRHRNRDARRGLDAAIALPHGQKLAANPDVLLDDV